MPTDDADVVLRRAEPDEVEALAALHLASRAGAGAAMPESVHPPEDAVPWLAGQLADPDREVWVAHADGGPAGYLVLAGEWLDQLFVHPEHAGAGLGSALLDLAKSLRPTGFTLWVFEVNAPARRFYARRGLLEVERTDGSDNEERAPDVAMQWPGRVESLRAAVDALDDDLADLLTRRATLTERIQRAKVAAGQPAGGAGRDAVREAEIVHRMAQRAPHLGADRLRAIMHAVITQSLDATRLSEVPPDPGPDTPGA